MYSIWLASKCPVWYDHDCRNAISLQKNYEKNIEGSSLAVTLKMKIIAYASDMDFITKNHRNAPYCDQEANNNDILNIIY
jgi:hypothetical protein